MILEVEKTIQLEASRERVWRAITEGDEIAAWFPESIRWEAQPGGEGWFGWKRHGRFSVRIETLEPPRFMAWRWAREADKPLDDTDTTLVQWTLTVREAGGTTLHLKETGFKSEEYMQGNNTGWNHELGELTAHLGEADAQIV